MGLDYDAGTSVSCSYQVDSLSHRQDKAGTHDSHVQCDSFGPSNHAVVTQDQGVFPKGQPIVHPSDVKEAKAPVMGNSCHHKTLMTDTSLHGLGCGPIQPLDLRSVDRSPSFMAHKLPGDDGCISSTEILPLRSQRIPCPCAIYAVWCTRYSSGPGAGCFQ